MDSTLNTCSYVIAVVTFYLQNLVLTSPLKSLTDVTSLPEKYKIDPKQIGRLEVGSETAHGIFFSGRTLHTLFVAIQPCAHPIMDAVSNLKYLHLKTLQRL